MSDPAALIRDQAILEAAARALYEYKQSVAPQTPSWKAMQAKFPDYYSHEATAILAAVTPLIEANALERAAKVADGFKNDLPPGIGRGIAAAIRSLKAHP